VVADKGRVLGSADRLAGTVPGILQLWVGRNLGVHIATAAGMDQDGLIDTRTRTAAGMMGTVADGRTDVVPDTTSWCNRNRSTRLLPCCALDDSEMLLRADAGRMCSYQESGSETDGFRGLVKICTWEDGGRQELFIMTDKTSQHRHAFRTVGQPPASLLQRFRAMAASLAYVKDAMADVSKWRSAITSVSEMFFSRGDNDHSI
jgi:hypothetical protein